MSKYKRPARQDSYILSDDELEFFYKNILLYCENDEFKKCSFGRFDDFKKAVKKEKGLESFAFIYEDYLKEMKSPQKDIFYFSAETEKSKNQTSRKNSDILKKLFRHIRNAFAHNYILKQESDNSIILRDYEPSTYKPTLYACISSIDKLKKLVDLVKQTESKASKKGGNGKKSE